jgi:hypothetical protein
VTERRHAPDREAVRLAHYVGIDARTHGAARHGSQLAFIESVRARHQHHDARRGEVPGTDQCETLAWNTLVQGLEEAEANA